MGSANSPVTAGRFGGSLIQLILETIPEFQGKVDRYDSSQFFQGTGFDPANGVGCVFMCPDGSPA